MLKFSRNSHVLWLAMGTVGLGGVAVAILLGSVSPASAVPTITWTPSSINAEVARGHSKTLTLYFTASEGTKGVTVRVVPELQPFVQVSPTTFPIITAGQRLSLSVIFRASINSAAGTFNGTIHLIKGNTIARPLPVSLLVTAVPLPPDPGQAGKATLEGIDSDRDGVRDDVQRYIVLTYPDSQKTRAALTQDAISLHATLRDANDKNASIANALSDGHAANCESYILGTSRARSVFNELRAQVLNTKERSVAYITANSQLAGQVYEAPPIPQRKAGCNFDPDAVEN